MGSENSLLETLVFSPYALISILVVACAPQSCWIFHSWTLTFYIKDQDYALYTNTVYRLTFHILDPDPALHTNTYSDLLPDSGLKYFLFRYSIVIHLIRKIDIPSSVSVYYSSKQ